MTPCGFGATLEARGCDLPAEWTVTGSDGACTATVPACPDHAEHLGDAFTSKGIRYLLRPLREEPAPAPVAPPAPSRWLVPALRSLAARVFGRRDPEEAA